MGSILFKNLTQQLHRIYILPKAKSAAEEKDYILGFSFFNIDVIQKPMESSVYNNNRLKYRENNSIRKKKLKITNLIVMILIFYRSYFF